MNGAQMWIGVDFPIPSTFPKDGRRKTGARVKTRKEMRNKTKAGNDRISHILISAGVRRGIRFNRFPFLSVCAISKMHLTLNNCVKSLLKMLTY
jgi:hypothetical protein